MSRPPADPAELGPDRWDARWRDGNTPWDLGEAPPALLALLEDASAPPALDVLVPGAGSGHDAIAWARAGHHVVAVDHAPRAIAVARTHVEAAGVHVTLLEADVLALPADLEEAFDVVWEQTCLCALHPGQRGAYVEAMARVLRPGGVLHALLWNHGHEGGPPFDVSPEDAHAAFRGPFALEHLTPVPSHPRRSHEFLARWRRTP